MLCKEEEAGGDFEHAPQPPRFFSPGTEKGDRARHMPGGKRVCQLRTLRIRTYSAYSALSMRLRVRAPRDPANLLARNENESESARARAPCIQAFQARWSLTTDPVISRARRQ